MIGLSGLVHSNALISTWAQAIYPVAILVSALAFLEVTRADPRLLTWCAAAVAIGLLLGAILQPAGVSSALPVIKSGLGLAAVIGVLAIGSLLRLNALASFSVSLALAVWLLLADFRSAAVVCAVSGFIVLFSRGKTVASGVVKVMALACLAGVVGLSGYTWAVQSGVLGEAALTRYDQQMSNEAGLLVGGRPEVVISRVAIESHPWIGRGGNPQFTFSERLEALGALSSSGIEVSAVQAMRLIGTGINSHSLIFGSWVENGLLGIVPWLAFAVFLWAGSIAAVSNRMRLAPLLVFGTVQTSWDLFFSPWSARYDVWLGLLCAIAFASLAHSAFKPAVTTLGEASVILVKMRGKRR